MKHKLPPQKIAITNHGEVNKTFIIGAVSIILVILLGIFLFFQGTLAGKAFFSASTETNSPQLEITQSNDGLNLYVKINNPSPSKTINALYFELANDALCEINVNGELVTASNMLIQNQLYDLTNDWGDLEESGCYFDDNSVPFFYFGAASVTPGNFRADTLIDVLTLTFTTPLPNPLNLVLSNVAVYDINAVDDVATTTDETNLFAATLSSTIPVPRPQLQIYTAPAPQPAPAQSAPGGNANSGGGGGFTCVKQWVCDDWSACENNEQSRSCYDKKNCTTSVTVRGRSYPQVVIDRKGMPNITQSCKGGIITSVKTPAQTTSQVQAHVQQPLPLQTQAKPVQTTQPKTQKLTLAQVWASYKSLVILGPVSLILLIVVIILFLHHFQHKKVAYNYDELKSWIVQEKKMGTSEDDIKLILAQNTGWKKKEVEEMFGGLESPLIKKYS